MTATHFSPSPHKSADLKSKTQGLADHSCSWNKKSFSPIFPSIFHHLFFSLLKREIERKYSRHRHHRRHHHRRILLFFSSPFEHGIVCIWHDDNNPGCLYTDGITRQAGSVMFFSLSLERKKYLHTEIELRREREK